MTTTCMVFFQAAACDLDAAAASLAGYGLAVQRDGDQLSVTRAGAPTFTVIRVVAPHVRAEAIEIGESSEHQAALQACDARFEIGIADLDVALDEINTFIEVQGALQDACRGYAFMPWNGNVCEPWDG